MTTKWMLCLFLLCWSAVITAQSNPISSGDVIDGQLTPDTLDMTYTFAAQAGDKITVRLSSRQFDALLQIIDGDGTEVTRNDDSEGSLNSVIEAFEVPDDGDYTIIVTSSDGTETGDYELSFTRISIVNIAYGESIEGSLPENEEDFYQFEGTKGDLISIRMVSSQFDSFLRLADENFELIADDNGGGGWHAMISAFTLPQTGIYRITASPSFGGVGVSGDYTLYLDQIDPTLIAVNEPLTDTLVDDPLYYTFEPKMGETISVFVTSEGGLLDTLLTVKSDFTWYGLDDDGGYRYDPEIIDILITNPDSLFVIILPSSGDVRGEFELLVSTESSTELTCDSDTSVTFSNKVIQIPFQIAVENGQTVELTYHNLTRNRGDLFTYFVLNDNYLSEDYNTNDEQEWITSVTVSEAGHLYIMASDYSQLGTTYQLSVSCP